jgi:hypothetical protein
MKWFTNIKFVFKKIPLQYLNPGSHFGGRALKAKINVDTYEFDYKTVVKSKVTAVMGFLFMDFNEIMEGDIYFQFYWLF